MKPQNVDVFCVGEVDVVYRKRGKTTSHFYVKNSSDAEKFFRERWEPSLDMCVRESMFAIFLNRAHRIIGMSQISKGSITGIVVDNRIIARIALRMGASSVILAHNHPSGNLRPSEGDLNVTKSVKSALKLIDVDLLDHLIMTEESYYSFADNGEMQ